MEKLIIQPKNNEQLEAVKSILKILKIPFDKKESHYDAKFVKKIYEAEENHNEAIILNDDGDIDNYFKDIEQNV